MYFSMSAASWPNRLVTIFTSSGCETSLGMRRSSVSAGIGLNPATIAIENAGDSLRSQIVVEVVIHLDRRRPATGSNAFHLFEGKHPVRCNALVTHAKLFLETLEEVVRPAQHAADVGADLDVEFCRRLETQHRIVAGHVAHLEPGQAQALGNLGHHRV